jgi:hypothetical protein
VREVVVDPQTGKSKKSSVNTRTSSTSFATALHVSRHRCWIYYTDHARYYEKSEEGFYVLTDDNEPEVAVSNTRHGRPEGRGKSENVLGKTKQGLVARFASSYTTRAEIKAAQQAAVTKNITYDLPFADSHERFVKLAPPETQNWLIVLQRGFENPSKRSR